jgi:hypothetical protein
MGRPIKKTYFGLTSDPGNQIIVNGVKFADGTTASNAYIVKQVGSDSYIVQDTALSHAPEIVFMVNATSTSGLSASQCYILATPFGGSARPCSKIAQYRLDLYEADGSITSYSWSTIPASQVGQADLINGGGVSGSILSVALGVAGKGYFTAPTVYFTGAGGSGATATAAIANGAVTGFTVNTAGAGYADGGVLLGAPPASITATATGTATAGAVNNPVTVSIGGGYYTVAPAVTVVGGNGNAVAHATISGGHVTAVVIDTPGTGYVTPVAFTIAAPPAAVQATATATISV